MSEDKKAQAERDRNIAAHTVTAPPGPGAWIKTADGQFVPDPSEAPPVAVAATELSPQQKQTGKR